MKAARTLALLAAVCLSSPIHAQAIAGDATVQAQCFTGSLEAPSPALPKAGLLAVEPYLIFQDNTGAYDNRGTRHSINNHVIEDISATAFKYALTDRLTVEAIPLVAHLWNGQKNATGVGDLPVELEYRFNDENNTTGFPSVTASMGMSLPLGKYDRLQSPIDGLGSGAYTAKEGILFQSLFDTRDHHPLRLRFYAVAFEPMGDVSIHGIDVYGTDAGFAGHVRPGVSSRLGIGVGYGLDHRWLLGFDLVQKFWNGARIRGFDASGASVNTMGEHGAQTSVAPALEYNFSHTIGVVAGVEFSVAGRNTTSYVAPQIALSMVF